jgi:hypothetical protein
MKKKVLPACNGIKGKPERQPERREGKIQLRKDSLEPIHPTQKQTWHHPTQKTIHHHRGQPGTLPGTIVLTSN